MGTNKKERSPRLTILLLRHAHAGDKARWRGNDVARPLSQRGRAEAASLVGTLRPFGVSRIVASPHLRCLQTVEPLAKEVKVDVERVEELSPGQGRTLEWLRQVEAAVDDVLLACTHGEVIGPIVTGLRKEDGVDFGADPSWEKASVWVLLRNGRDFVGARFLPAPKFPSA